MFNDIPPGLSNIVIALLALMGSLGTAYFLWKSKRIEVSADSSQNIDTQEAEFRKDIVDAYKRIKEEYNEQANALKTMEAANLKLRQDMADLSIESKADKAAIGEMTTEITLLRNEIEGLRQVVVKLAREKVGTGAL